MKQSRDFSRLHIQPSGRFEAELVEGWLMQSMTFSELPLSLQALVSTQYLRKPCVAV